MRKWVLAVLGATMLTMPALAADTLNVWWVKGFYKSEDDALYAAIKKFEDKTGVKVELSQYPVQDMIPKTVSALDSGNPPDVAYADVYDFQVAGKWAYEGKLEDVSSTLLPLKDKFAPKTLETTFLFNNVDKKRSYYAFPMKQQTMHVEVWLDMLAQIGIKEADIPKDWKGYWSFWCDKVQPAGRKATGQRVYGIGQPMGVDSSDSFYSFLTFADAYDARMVDDEGKLTVDDPKVREALINAMTDYTMPYSKSCTPPSSTTWRDPDNNIAFHNRTTYMTHNATISIAAKWLDDNNNTTLSDAERATAKKHYYEDIATTGFPLRPDGKPMKYRTAVKVGVIFKQAQHKELAKQFVAFMLEDANLQPYVEGSLGRWFPVMKAAQEDPFWLADRHRKSVHDQYASGTVTFEFTRNWKFTILNNENVWAKAMNRIVNEKVPVEKAVDEMIARIKDVAG